MRQEGKQTPVAGILLAITFVALFSIPVDFVRPSSLFDSINRVLVFLGFALTIYVFFAVPMTNTLKKTLTVIFVGLCLWALVFANVGHIYSLGLPLLMGLAVSQVSSLVRPVLYATFGLVAISLAGEWFLVSHLFSSIVGDLNFDFQGSVESFRARGIVGQPVPAAHITIGLAWALVAINVAAEKVQYILQTTLFIVVVSSVLFITGTRSAVITLLAVGLVYWWQMQTRQQEKLTSKNTRFAAMGVALVIITFGLSQLGSRALDFSGIQDTTSQLNRLLAINVLNIWSQECDVGCKIIGSGYRNLQDNLGTSIPSLGFRTIDNSFVTILWDFGMIGLGLVLASFYIVLFGKRIHKKAKIDKRYTQAGRLGAIGFFVSGFFFDAIYVRPSIMLFGLFLGIFIQHKNGKQIGHGQI
jgi:hypothetical protein